MLFVPHVCLGDSMRYHVICTADGEVERWRDGWKPRKCPRGMKPPYVLHVAISQSPLPDLHHQLADCGSDIIKKLCYALSSQKNQFGDSLL